MQYNSHTLAKTIFTLLVQIINWIASLLYTKGKSNTSTRGVIGDVAHLLFWRDVDGEDGVAAGGVLVHVVWRHRTVPQT